MTLTELRYVMTLAQEKHFGRAAKACRVSQPSLSIAIQKLEAELGVAIFERNRNTVNITPIGQHIISQSQRVLDEVNTITAIAKQGKSQLKSPLRVGAILTMGPYFFPNIIPRLKKIAPEMPLIIQEDYTANLRVKLQQGELDVIFVTLPFTEPGVVTKPLYDEPFVILMRKDHLLSKQKSIKVSELKGEEILLLGEGHCLREQVIRACPQFDYHKTQAIHDGVSLETLRHMVASGVGVTILPSTATQTQYYKSMLCTKPFAGKTPERRIALAWRASCTRPSAIHALIQTLQASTLNGICLLPNLFT